MSIPFIPLRGQTPSSFLLIFLLYRFLPRLAQVPYTSSSLCPWVEPLLKTTLEQLPSPSIDTSTSISTVLFGWVHLENSPPHDTIASSHCLDPLWYVQLPMSPNFTIFIIALHSLPLPYTLLINQEMKGWSTMFFPDPSFRKEKWLLFDLNLILSTFLETTSTISASPYLINLIHSGKNKITLS